MSLTYTDYETAVVVHMPEKLTSINSVEIKKEIAQQIERFKDNLVIDLAGLNYSDSSGLAVLVGIYKTVAAAGGQAVLLSPQPAIRSLLELTRLNELFEIYQDPKAAVERVSRRGIKQ